MRSNKATLTLADVMSEMVTEIIKNETAAMSSDTNKSTMDLKKQGKLGKVISSSLTKDDQGYYVLTHKIDINNFLYDVVDEGTSGDFNVLKEETTVQIDYDQDGEPYVSLTNDVTEKHIVAEEGVYVNSSGVHFNGAEFGGMVIIQELTDKLNDLISDFNSHKHSGVVTSVSGGSGAPAVGVVGTSGTSTTTADDFDKDDYENITVQHGETP